MELVDRGSIEWLNAIMRLNRISVCQKMVDFEGFCEGFMLVCSMKDSCQCVL